MANRIHIIVAEPSSIIRSGLVSILHQDQSLKIDIAEISDVSTLSTTMFTREPDILIINPTQLGHFSPASLKNSMGNGDLKIVALQTTFIDQGMLQYYDKVVSIGDSSDTILEKLRETINQEAEKEHKKDDLSSREKEIIVSVVKGMTNKQIADTLFLSVHTVIAHRRNIASKLQIHSPSGLTIYAIVNKLVDLSDIKNSITQVRESE